MGDVLCLKCRKYKISVVIYRDGTIRHPSMSWGCSLLLHPKEGKDDKGNVVADYCNDFLSRKVEVNRK